MEPIEPGPGLAVFDLDGTLIRRDSFVPFLVSFGRRHGVWSPMVAIPLVGGAYAARLISAHTGKQSLMRLFFRDRSREQIGRHADWFCRHWVDRQWNPPMVDRLHQHQSLGHRVILLSASPDVYVPAIARRLGVGEVVCTKVEWAGDRCVGRIDGENCKGEAKVRMLKAHLGQLPQNGTVTYSYGDSNSDHPVLRWAKHGYRLRGERYQRVSAS